MVRSSMALVLGVATVLAATAGAMGQPCGARWTNPTPPPDVAGSVLCLWEDDDVAPPHGRVLYVAGLFPTVSGEVVNNIAKWDGVAWSALGAGTDGAVLAMVVFDDDGPAGPHPRCLYAAGNFSTAGGQDAQGIAKWDGSVWSAVGDGFTGGSGGVRALAVYDDDGDVGPNPPALYAGGYFLFSGGTPLNHLAKWDPVGAVWADVGGGLSDGVTCLAVFDEDGPPPDGPERPLLYAGGYFALAGSGSIPAIGIARWNGSTWQEVGGGLPGNPFNGVAHALLVRDDDGPGGAPPVLYVGGEFATAGTTPAANIARWNGAAWTALGDGVTGGAAPIVTSLADFDDDGPPPGGPRPTGLYVCGRFTLAGSGTANNVARWDAAGGGAWTTLQTGADSANAILSAATAYAPAGGEKSLIVGGDLTLAGGVAVTNIASWSGTSWSPLSADLRVAGSVLALTAIDDDGAGPGGPVLFVGGSFTSAGAVAASNIARKDGAGWSKLGQGLSGAVNCVIESAGIDIGTSMAVPGIIACGNFTMAGGSPASHVAVWDGSVWSAIGAGNTDLNGNVYAAAVYDSDGPGPSPPMLYVGGDFTMAGSVAALRIARWDGTAWAAVGSGVGAPVRALHVFDIDGLGPVPAVLIAGGDFVTAGAATVNRIAAWDGNSWAALGTGTVGVSGSDAPAVDSLCTLDETPFGAARRVLVAGGRFTSAGGVSAPRVARWDGSVWSAMGAGIPGSFSDVTALAVFDEDGPTPGGVGLFAGGSFSSPGRSIARWNGSTWSQVGPGIGVAPPVMALAGIDRDRTGPIAPALQAGGSFGLRTWAGCDASCAGDLDRNGSVQPADIMLFVGTWLAGLSGGSLDGDADLNSVIEPQDVAVFIRAWFEDLMSGCH